MPEQPKRTLDKTRKLHRLLSIVRMLDNREPCTPLSLSKHFKTTERNIFRDMKDLSAVGFDVTFDKNNKSYTFADADFTLRDMELSDEELMALLIGKQMTHGLGKPFESAFDSLLKKARKDTGEKTRKTVKRLEGREMFHVNLNPIEGFEGIEKQYRAITDAMDRKVELLISYKGMHDQKVTERQIAPYGLVFSDGMWYAVARCSLRHDTRIFALDCIRKFWKTGKKYSIPSEFSLDEYLKPGWKIMRYGKPVEVVLRFTKDVARWIKRRKWHPSQTIEEQEDGSIIYRAKVSHPEEIKYWSYAWVPNCEIISPPELRNKAAEEIKALGEVYSTTV